MADGGKGRLGQVRRHVGLALFASTALLLSSCGGNGSGTVTPAPSPTPSPTPSPSPTPTPTPSPTPTPTTSVTASVIATLDNPWAMVFLPDGRMLVTERPGRLRVITQGGAVGAPISGTPAVQATGQGGLLDVALDPAYASNRRIYLSYAEAGSGGAGTAVARGTLTIDPNGNGSLADVTVIWRQTPKISGDTRHYGGRMAFSPDGFLFVTAGERHQGAPAQDLSGTLGKIIRIRPDGSVPNDNPFVATPNARPEIWTLGHRNPYGLVFAEDGRLFASEHGPEGGDEFNLITRGANYGWRIVSEGNDGEVLPRHSTRPEFAAPLVVWTPSVAPGGMIQYRGTRFVGWDGDFILAGLQSQGLIRVRVTQNGSGEIGRIPLNRRIREVEQGADGAIWVLEDGARGRLVKLVPQ
ncbi:PQQ-dependent sugar dehydrogenase [Allosphingosinicella indica]|uniref:Glucose/arabinose dehydrogenase, beta-propeller fold n=1 Tax=Allosphingosinicella indica TaxID=941907 RepID=A0A1X7GU49_9SPHN|nr:PQQ-dependent sugar dehydrogenase [Allosphingosinicella indica]SMF74592.1 Glucose/arabinose dehydrogenase, beta-propeller fold [Allosphingosinicella indica]